MFEAATKNVLKNDNTIPRRSLHLAIQNGLQAWIWSKILTRIWVSMPHISAFFWEICHSILRYVQDAERMRLSSSRFVEEEETECFARIVSEWWHHTVGRQLSRSACLMPSACILSPVAFVVRFSPANVVQPKKLKHGLCINSMTVSGWACWVCLDGLSCMSQETRKDGTTKSDLNNINDTESHSPMLD
jgi:hypothetical protein